MILGPPPDVPALIIHAACTVPSVPIILPSAQEVAQARRSLAGYKTQDFDTIMKSVESLALAPPAPAGGQQDAEERAQRAADLRRMYKDAAALPDAAGVQTMTTTVKPQPIQATVPAGLSTDCSAPLPKQPDPLVPGSLPQDVQPQPPDEFTPGMSLTSPSVPAGALLAPRCSSTGTQESPHGNANTGAIRASDFTRTLAVENHFRNGGPYTLEAVKSALAYLNPNGAGTGVSTVRDDTVSSGSDLAALGALGYKLDIYQSYNPDGGNSYGQYTSMLSPLVQAGYVALIEGGLEVDNGGWGLAVHGGSYTASDGRTSSGYAATAAMGRDMMQAFGGQVPIAGPSMADPSSGDANSVLAQGANQVGGAAAVANIGNVHYYPHNGNPPNIEMPGVIAQETGWTPGMPFAMTETGYNDCNCSNYGGNKLANAAYTLNLFLDAFKAGSILTAYYELFDEPQYDGTGIAYEAHWGLFNADGTPKPSATSLRNFVAIIGDANSDGASFANCGAINYTLAGMPDSAKSLLMQKADGTYELVIWNDTNIMAGQSGNHTIGIDLGGSYDYSVFDPLIGTTAIQSGKGSSLSVNVSDHPVIIELGGAPGTNVSKVSTQAPSAANNSTTTKTVAGGSTGSQKQASLPSSGSSSAGGSGGTGSSTTPVVVSTSQSLSSSTGEKANGPATGAQTYSMNGLNGLATNFANWGGVTTLANNGEQQNYVPGQVSVNSDGSVTLSGRPANGSDNSSLPYVSGMVETSQTFSQQYGYFEIETKIPAGKGVWPAFWLFGKDSHAMYREVDVFEFTGDPHVLNFSTHFGSQGNGKTTPITLPFDASQGMHTYGVDWTPTTFTLYVDGKPLATQDATGFAGQGDMYMIANVALGGNWPGNPDSTTPFPATMPIKSIGAWAAPTNP